MMPSTSRAAKACSTCKTRKVRCDVLRVGLPCTKCRNSNFRCSIEPRKKRRSKVGAKGIGDNVGPGPLLQVNFPEHIIRHQIPHYGFFQRIIPIGISSRSLGDSKSGLSLPVISHDGSDNFRGPDPGISEQDMQFLREKEALDLPQRSVLDECVSVYFKFFHSSFPIIDRSSFLAGYGGNGVIAEQEGKGPSLLLLQAILFTASTVGLS